MKKCSQCGTELSLSEFYNRKDSSDGRMSRCKKCTNESTKRWRLANIEKHRLFGRRAYNRFKLEHGLTSAALRMRANQTLRHAYSQTQHMLRRNGRPDTCSRCGAKGNIHVHHPDYSKSLEVIMLCRPCHLLAHGKQVRVAV